MTITAHTVLSEAFQALFVVTAAGVIVATAWARRPGHRTPAPLPPATLAHAQVDRPEQAREVLDEARSELAALDREVDATRADEQHLLSWQHALDHQAAAHRVLERSDAFLDVVGALVLARRGREALRVADAGWEWTPLPGCFLNPLHREPTKRRRIKSDGRVLAVLLCDACREALRHGRPPDVLDVMHGGRPLHYFDTRIEPWASTGFGSLEPDLVSALHGHRL